MPQDKLERTSRSLIRHANHKLTMFASESDLPSKSEITKHDIEASKSILKLLRGNSTFVPPQKKHSSLDDVQGNKPSTNNLSDVFKALPVR